MCLTWAASATKRANVRSTRRHADDCARHRARRVGLDAYTRSRHGPDCRGDRTARRRARYYRARIRGAYLIPSVVADPPPSRFRVTICNPTPFYNLLTLPSLFPHYCCLTTLSSAPLP
ncbi:hypothetical protein K523DRAFT_156466 [Schizophyllum commune Tattone D]|nr:hypothetical protein K523DRAFT_156466 [Schizophyllum commune Tattone D]